jgi:hypothetical protein
MGIHSWLAKAHVVSSQREPSQPTASPRRQSDPSSEEMVLHRSQRPTSEEEDRHRDDKEEEVRRLHRPKQANRAQRQPIRHQPVLPRKKERWKEREGKGGLK